MGEGSSVVVPEITDEAFGVRAVDVMHAEVEGLPPAITVGEVRGWFAVSSRRRLAVIADGRRYVASFTETDVPPDVAGDRPALEFARDRPVLPPDATVVTVRNLVVAADARRLPVVDVGGALHGVVAVATDLRFLTCRPRPTPEAVEDLIKDEWTDETLMVRVQRGDARAFEILYDRHWNAVFWLAMRIIDDRGLAADATQEAFMSLWRYRDRYRPDRGRLRWWLQSIVRNRAIDVQRRNRGDVPSSPTPFELIPAPDSTEGEALAENERRELAHLVALLPSEQRAVIELAFYTGLSHAEITERLGVPLGTIKSRIRSGLERLRLGLPRDGTQTTTT